MKEYKRQVLVNGKTVELEGNMPIPKPKKRGVDYVALARRMRVNESFLIKGSTARVRVGRAFKEAGVPFVIRVLESGRRWRIWKTGEAEDNGVYNLGE